MSCHLTSSHLVSPHLASPRLASPVLNSTHLTSVWGYSLTLGFPYNTTCLQGNCTTTSLHGQLSVTVPMQQLQLFVKHLAASSTRGAAGQVPMTRRLFFSFYTHGPLAFQLCFPAVTWIMMHFSSITRCKNLELNVRLDTGMCQCLFLVRSWQQME